MPSLCEERWAVPLLDRGCAVNRAAVRITSASLLPRLDCVNGQTAEERGGILALERCAEFCRSCLFCAGRRPGYLEWRIRCVIWSRREHPQLWVKSLEDVLSERRPLCGAKYSAGAHQWCLRLGTQIWF